MMARESGPGRSSRSRPAIFAALVLVLAVLGIGLTGFEGAIGFIDDWSGGSERAIAASPVQPAPYPPVAETPKEAVPAPREPLPPAAPAPMLAESLAAGPAPLTKIESSAAREPAKPAPPDAAPAPQSPREMQAAAKAQEPASTARLILAVSPRGELYINGKRQGTTPPITTFPLEPGMHRIEVRNGSRKPYLTYMTVEAGDVRRIRHDFNAKPSRLPR
jgi:hypothetical protein